MATKLIRVLHGGRILRPAPIAPSSSVLSFSEHHGQRNEQNRSDGRYIVGAVVATGAATALYLLKDHPSLGVSAKQDETAIVGERKSGLPEFSMSQVANHRSSKKGVWVSYGNGVYDVTKLINEKDKPSWVVEAAGKQLELFWPKVPVKDNGRLELFRIGNLVEEDVKKNETVLKAGAFRKDLPTFRMKEVAKHDNADNRIWVTYRHGVYDITDFIPRHPGAGQILMAAGSSVEPFWQTYAVHLSNPIVCELIEQYRIGNLHETDVEENKNRDSFDPFATDPVRTAEFHVQSEKPFNAETPLGTLVKDFVTPNDRFYIRNHLPVPNVSIKDYELEIEGLGVNESTLSFDDLKKFKKHTVMAAIQCGGNRRSVINQVKPVKGLEWQGGAIGNATWSGARLCDVIMAAGFTEEQLQKAKHVQFEGYDVGSDSSPFGASIPIEKALNPFGDVILAYEMNGEPLPRDHGYPVRVVVPGVVGARNVKWLNRIVLSEEESDSHWQQKDYKTFNPSVDWSSLDYSKSPAIQNMPVTSSICSPDNTEPIKDGKLRVEGYAWSGGGAKVMRVDITVDGGKTWTEAELKQSEDPPLRTYAWTLWSIEIEVPKGQEEIEVWSRAVDWNNNVQPEEAKNIWNVRGLCANSISKTKFKVAK